MPYAAGNSRRCRKKCNKENYIPEHASKVLRAFFIHEKIDHFYSK